MIVANEPIFIVGCGRSGTTLLRTILTTSENIMIPPESDFLWRAAHHFDHNGKMTSDKIDEFVTFVENIGSFRRSFDFQPGHLNAYLKKHKPTDLADCISLVYQAYAEQSNKKRWGDKNPFYVLYLDLILGLFPNAKIIHIIRDGRDVAVSYRKTHMNPRNLFLLAKRWKRCVISGRSWGEKYPDKYIEIYYEKLIEQPEIEVKRLCNFIGEEFNEGILQYSNNKTNINLVPIHRRDHHENLGKPIIRSNKEKWKKEMNGVDLKVFEWVSGDTLELAGYHSNNLKIPFWLRINLLWCQLRYCIGMLSIIRKIADISHWRLKRLIRNSFLIDTGHYR